jgi:hypothetical protein
MGASKMLLSQCIVGSSWPEPDNEQGEISMDGVLEVVS